MASREHTEASSLPEVQTVCPHAILRKYKGDKVTRTTQIKEPKPSKGEQIQIPRARYFWNHWKDSCFLYNHSSAEAESGSVHADEKVVAF